MALSFPTFRVWLPAVLGCLLVLAGGNGAEAGVFNIPRFVTPGNVALGLEPELVLTDGAGFGINGRMSLGLNDLMNVHGIIGTGSGPRNFRFGGGLTWDFFPDVAGQPGIGLGTQALYVRLPTDGQLELTAIPYIHKAFLNEGNEVEPYFAIPLGLAFISGQYHAIANVAIGAMFKNTEKFRYIAEFGLAVNNSETYFSGGIVYYQ